ncbi:MAG: D-alanyl-D-alanine carboxypeptidase family protein [Treponemataceae bacterium]|nr:MAG: D-alanyl-D-alanine carboxypeptidase family protein [Treponemataceae bacterium]
MDYKIFFAECKENALKALASVRDALEIFWVQYFRGRRIRQAALVAFLCIASFFAYVLVLAHPQTKALLPEERAGLLAALETRYPHGALLQKTYSVRENPEIQAGSAIIVDAATGLVLFEKNADMSITPASMTKLVGMYIALSEVEKGTIDFDDIVPLPPDSWAANAPSGSSLMGLARGHVVTLRELLLGMALPSGNDAAVAVADYISGNAEDFCSRMNALVASMGLVNTHFVDTSGYSELNETTARDFAVFTRLYMERFPQALSMFHSVRTFEFPTEQNFADEESWNKAFRTRRGVATAPTLILRNTNWRTLDTIAGCDGLKTGTIPESGANLALTVERDGTRILSISMKGPGKTGNEAANIRGQDAQAIADFSFRHFETQLADNFPGVDIPVALGKKNALRVVSAVPGALLHVTVPKRFETDKNVTSSYVYDDYAVAPIEAGTVLGRIVYKKGDLVLREIPLVADRSVSRANGFKRAVDTVAKVFL